MHVYSRTRALLCPGSYYDATLVKSPPSPLATIMTWMECGKITRFYCIQLLYASTCMISTFL